MKTGSELIAEERQRQISEEGWTPEHDDEHSAGQLAMAAASYAIVDVDEDYCDIDPVQVIWPWDWNLTWWKPRDRVKNLVKAGALIAAEIDRLQRLSGAV